MRKTYAWLIIIIALLAVTIVKAGALTGSGSPPAATLHTLQNLCDRLTTNAAATEGSHTFIEPTGQPSGTQCTLTQLYNLIPSSADAVKIKSGVTYFGITGTYPSANNPLAGDTAAVDATAIEICSNKEAWGKDGTLLTGALAINAAKVTPGTSLCGVAGTAQKNMFNGSGLGFSGGSSGGIDDYNNAGAPPSDRYTCQWIACNAGNNYCNTGAAGADIKDECTGLIWSKACGDTGCSTLDNRPSGSGGVHYSWNSSAVNNGSLTATQLCSQGLHGQAGWYLPHQRHLMQAYIDGFYGNSTTEKTTYWSSTARADSPNGAWRARPYLGSISSDSINSVHRILCIRLS